MEASEFRPMSVGQILDRAFRLYRQNFVRFVAIIAILQVPIALLNMLLQYVVGGTVRAGDVSTGLGVALVGTLILAFFAMLSNSLSNAALLKSVSASYLGQSVTVGQAYRFVWPKLLTLIGASFLVGIIVAVGFVLLIVPGIIFSLWFILTTQAIVLEDLKATKGMGRSKRLVSGNLGKVFLIGLVVFLITGIVGAVLGWLGGALGATVAKDSPALGTLIVQLSSMISTILTMPIGAAAMILLYYDLRIRKEGFDLEMLASRFAAKEAGPDAAMPTP